LAAWFWLLDKTKAKLWLINKQSLRKQNQKQTQNSKKVKLS
jgi:hypothetical protein